MNDAEVRSRQYTLPVVASAATGPGREYGASAEGAITHVDRRRAGGARPPRPRLQRARGPGHPCQAAARGGRRRLLHGRRPHGGAPERGRGGPAGRAVQPRGPGRRDAAIWGRSAGPVRHGRTGAHPRRVPPRARSGTRRHGHLVAHHAATGAAPGSGWAAHGEHGHDSGGAVGSRVHLAAESQLVPYRHGPAPPAGWDGGAGARLPRHPQKEVIERAYRVGEACGLQVWCQDEAGPYQAVPQPGASWQLEGDPARQPHEYLRGGTAKLLTLFRPATGEVRAEPVDRTPNAVLHGWLRRELAAIVAAGPPAPAEPG